jgi:hypothetical protein
MPDPVQTVPQRPEIVPVSQTMSAGACVPEIKRGPAAGWDMSAAERHLSLVRTIIASSFELMARQEATPADGNKLSSVHVPGDGRSGRA